jgi:hypothetical protein
MAHRSVRLSEPHLNWPWRHSVSKRSSAHASIQLAVAPHADWPGYNPAMHAFSGLKRRALSAILLWVGLCCVCVMAWAAKEFVMPDAKPARTYPMHDEHKDEAVTAAVDPYDDPEKAAQCFTVKWAEEGMLPVFLVVTNDGDQPVSLTSMQAQLITSHRDKLSAATSDDLYRRLAHISTTKVYPLPIPHKVKGAVGKKALDEIDRAPFSAKAVEPHSTQSGFVFFDVSGISSPSAGARFYLTGVRNAKGGDLLYFEIPLQK